MADRFTENTDPASRFIATSEDDTEQRYGENDNSTRFVEST